MMIVQGLAIGLNALWQPELYIYYGKTPFFPVFVPMGTNFFFFKKFYRGFLCHKFIFNSRKVIIFKKNPEKHLENSELHHSKSHLSVSGL